MTEKYLTMEEAAQAVGCKRASLYNYMKALGITAHKFDFSKKHYLAAEDVERMRDLKARPWIVERSAESSNDAA